MVSSALAAHDPLAGLTRMSATELADAHGGFVTPQGLEISVGVQVQTTVNGQLIAQAPQVTAPSGTSVPAATAQLVQVASQGQISSVVHYATGNATTVVQNTVDNAVIQQLTHLNISVNNFTQIQFTNSPALTQLMQQVNLALVRSIK